MKPVKPARCFIALVLGLASACHDSSDGPPSFEPFVKNLIQAPDADTAEPIAVEGRSFSFSEAEGAFADVLPPDTGPVVE